MTTKRFFPLPDNSQARLKLMGELDSWAERKCSHDCASPVLTGFVEGLIHELAAKPPSISQMEMQFYRNLFLLAKTSPVLAECSLDQLKGVTMIDLWDTEAPPTHFDPIMFKAALAYYGLPKDYKLFWTADQDFKGQIDPVATSMAQKPVSVQLNPPRSGQNHTRKLSNKDIGIFQNLSLDFEIVERPQLAHVIGLELSYALMCKGFAKVGLPVEDSGAGIHIVIPVAPIRLEDEAEAELINKAVAEVVKKYILPEFVAICKSWQLDPRYIHLDGYDISRALSVPGTWRPGGRKENEALNLTGGVLRTWLAPYNTEKTYPSRRESSELADLVRAVANEISERPEREPVKVVNLAEIAQAGDSEMLREARRKKAYAENALVSEINKLLQAQPGTRNNSTFQAAANLAEFVAAGWLSESTVRSELNRAVHSIFAQTEYRDDYTAINQGFKKGLRNPRRIDLPEIPAYERRTS